MTKKLEQKFNIIKYSNCWEDADILLKALEVKRNGRYFSIASAGDNTFSILSRSPSLVIAADLNPAQLACVELKKLTFLEFSYDTMLKFLGALQDEKRVEKYKKIRLKLPQDARNFWDEHTKFIRGGIIHTGRFEKYFHIFRTKIIPLIHGKKTVQELLAPKTREERIKFYDKIWNNLRWRLIFKIFFGKTIMGLLGRGKNSFKYVECDVSSNILKRAKYALTELPTHNNPYLEYILKGNFVNSLPFYLRAENFDNIRKNLDKLILFNGEIDKCLKENRNIKFDGFNLSDIFEYISFNRYAAEIENILNSSQNGARLVYWNMLVDRKYPEKLKNPIKPLDKLANELFLQDKAFFYKSFIIEEVK